MGFNIEHADSLRKSHEYDHLFEYCKKYENDPDAMTELSTCYLYGYGTKANDNMCFYYDLKAAHLGSSTGKANLGYDYLHGIGTETNYKTGLKLLKQSIADGCPKAVRFLGRCYEFGTGVEKDETKAVELYQKAADMGDIVAVRFLGRCYEFGTGVEKDETKAVELYEKAANAGNKVAVRFLGLCYELGTGVEKDETKAVELYQKAADMGDIVAVRFLGRCYEFGTGVEKDETKAVELYEKAANAGDEVAVRFLGQCYEFETGVEKNETKAAELYEKAADMGDITALKYMGKCYRIGIGLKKDVNCAVEYLRKYLMAVKDSDNDNLANAWSELAECFQEQNDIPHMINAYNEALGYYSIMAKCGEKAGFAEYCMGEIREKGAVEIREYRRAFQHYEKSLIIGYNRAAHKVAIFYEYGKGIDEDKSKAFDIVKKYSMQDDINNLILGVYYNYGIGTKKDNKSAISIYSQYLDNNNPFISALAKFYLGICYYQGEGVPADVGTALSLFQRSNFPMSTFYINAIKDPNPENLHMLSLLYSCHSIETYYLKPDYKRAFDFSKEAYELSNRKKYQMELANIYFYGRGVKKNLQKAYTLYLEANNDQADQILGEYYYYGCVTARNYTKAIKYFDSGVRKRNNRAILYMVFCYFYGNGINRNVEYALELLKSVCNSDDLYGQYIIGFRSLLILSNPLLYKENESAAITDLEIISKKSSYWSSIFNVWNQVPTRKIATIFLNSLEKRLKTKYSKHFPYFSMVVLLIQVATQYIFQKKYHKDIWELKKELLLLKKEMEGIQEPMLTSVQLIADNQLNMQETIHEISSRTQQMENQLKQVIFFAKNDLQKWLQKEKEDIAPFIQNNNEEAIASFADKLANYLSIHIHGSDTLIQKETANLQSIFGIIWDRLLPTTQTSLVSAGVLWSYCADIGNNFDYSGVCISATSALESELKRVFYTGFQEYLYNHYGDPSKLPMDTVFSIWPEKLLNKTKAACQNEFLNTGSFVLGIGNSFTLGTLPYLFWDKNPVNRKLLQQRMKEYLQTIVKDCYADNPLKYINPLIKEGDKTIRDPNSFISQCEQIRENFRNPAAHIDIIPWEKADECYSEVVGKADSFRYATQAKGLIMKLYEFLK